MVRARRASASPLMTTTIAARSEVLVLCSFFSTADRRAALFSKLPGYVCPPA